MWNRTSVRDALLEWERKGEWALNRLRRAVRRREAQLRNTLSHWTGIWLPAHVWLGLSRDCSARKDAQMHRMGNAERLQTTGYIPF